MHCSRNAIEPVYNRCCDSIIATPSTGSYAFNCNCPECAATVTVKSLPITRNAIRLTSSGITGFTLPGMIDDPGCRPANSISKAPPAVPTPAKSNRPRSSTT